MQADSTSHKKETVGASSSSRPVMPSAALSETRPAKVGKWTEPALRVLRERYLMREGGEVVETPEEMCWRGALSVAAGGGPGGRGGAALRDGAGGGSRLMIGPGD